MPYPRCLLPHSLFPFDHTAVTHAVTNERTNQQVFDDYVSEMEKSSTLLTSLPTPVFWYGLVVGQEFSISPANPADLLLKGDVSGSDSNGSSSAAAATGVKIRLERVGPAKKGSMRTVSFTVGGAVQNVEVKDSVSGNDFDGPMADAGNALEVCVRARVCVSCITTVCTNNALCMYSVHTLRYQAWNCLASLRACVCCVLGLFWMSTVGLCLTKNRS